MKKASTFAAAFALAAAAFTITMLTKPPVTEARPIASIDTYTLTINAAPQEEAAFDAN
ncbi:hypothetical protein [Methylobacterium sp. R2-1]|uniref:hypothetical protein n=1 Tax=Methylobacterium sp. R2-1 TaxID=2587064 RepID=UPI00161D2800|nr:hypothetical protein [Methylobacterium sp. R2-1]MBB2964652.1 hypothetical protein [Methylobacterium sp. R2-1]